MSDAAVTEVRPHDRVIHIAVLRRSLDPLSTQQLTDDVQRAAAERDGVPIVLDLSQVRFAPSVALGALVQLSKGLRLEGRRLVIVGVQDRVRDAIHVTRLHETLEIHDTLERFVGSLSGRP